MSDFWYFIWFKNKLELNFFYPLFLVKSDTFHHKIKSKKNIKNRSHGFVATNVMILRLPFQTTTLTLHRVLKGYNGSRDWLYFRPGKRDLGRRERDSICLNGNGIFSTCLKSLLFEVSLSEVIIKKSKSHERIEVLYVIFNMLTVITRPIIKEVPNP